MGVEMRVHLFFPLLAIICLILSGSSGCRRWLSRSRSGAFSCSGCGCGGPRDSASAGGRMAGIALARHSAAAHRRTLCLCRSGEPGGLLAGRRAVCPGARRSGCQPCHRAAAGRGLPRRQRRCQALRPPLPFSGMAGAQHGLDADRPRPSTPFPAYPLDGGRLLRAVLPANTALLPPDAWPPPSARSSCSRLW